MDLILASASPRRRQLLDNAGIKYIARPADIDETVRPGETPDHFARRMAQEKASMIAHLSPSGSLILGADTVVEVAGEILGKPNDVADAQRMLRLLSGRDHQVLTGICVIRAPNSVEALQHETTRVTFSVLADGEIQRYVASGEPFDKAGFPQFLRGTSRVDCAFSFMSGNEPIGLQLSNHHPGLGVVSHSNSSNAVKIT